MRKSDQAFPAYRGYDAKPPYVPGMDLRTYIATQVLCGILSSPTIIPTSAVASAVVVADKLIEELEKNG